MKHILFFLVLFSSVSAFAETEVFFSPSKKCENGLIGLIEGSKDSVDVAVYSINNTNLVDALKKAYKRGVKIRILTDRVQAAGQSSRVKDLYDAGLNVRVHSKHKIEHNKFAIFDGKKASTGSYNWTNPATEKNSENCVFFTDNHEVVEDYKNRFDYLWRINTKKASDEWFEKH